jgi:hypothetical protein
VKKVEALPGTSLRPRLSLAQVIVGLAGAMFVLLSDTLVSGRLKHPDEGGNR